jgi:hypothetical protein
MSRNKTPLDWRLDRVGQHIVRARLFLDLWYYFEEHKSRQNIIETMREFNEFFRFTPHAYFASFVVYIAGVFETRSDTINLPALIKEMKTSGVLSIERCAVDCLMEKAKPLAKKATILRHKAIAHRTNEMSYDDVFRLAGVRPDELRVLTDIALDIANRLLASSNLKQRDFTHLPIKAAEQMMVALASKRT